MICFGDFGSADAPTWVAMHPPGLDASAEALGTTSKKGEKSGTNECESYYPPSSEFSAEGEDDSQFAFGDDCFDRFHLQCFSIQQPVLEWWWPSIENNAMNSN